MCVYVRCGEAHDTCAIVSIYALHHVLCGAKVRGGKCTERWRVY